MSSPSSEWVQIYQRNIISEQAHTQPTATDATSHGVISKGRVLKPTRKRSRASRRSPTTILSTNTANFRAMVQQFTGGPAATQFATGGGHLPSGVSLNFGLGTSQQMMVGRGGLSFVEELQGLEEQQQYHVVSVNSNSSNDGGQFGLVQSSRGGAMVFSGGMEGRIVSSSVSVRPSLSFNIPINQDQGYML